MFIEANKNALETEEQNNNKNILQQFNKRRKKSIKRIGRSK